MRVGVIRTMSQAISGIFGSRRGRRCCRDVSGSRRKAFHSPAASRREEFSSRMSERERVSGSDAFLEKSSLKRPLAKNTRPLRSVRTIISSESSAANSSRTWWVWRREVEKKRTAPA
ncbi:MAG: hypothetical protein D084_Lepto4C00555G0001 [Leptospirillum sp. Group IV 'UBA BS']|nr:MAG: hypothetical protein D084_Lepto4C00555G0001 [Leptospirillum sp. Group IV 'UBA BS']